MEKEVKEYKETFLFDPDLVAFRKIVATFKTEEGFSSFAKRHNLPIGKGISTCTITENGNVHVQDHGQFAVSEEEGKSKETSKARAEKEWLEMPEFYCSGCDDPYARVTFFFPKETELKKLSDFFGFNITKKTDTLQMDDPEWNKPISKRVIGGEHQPRWPIYVISKGRSQYNFTSNHLAKMEVHHFVVVEPQEAEAYKASVNSEYAEVLTLDMDYKRNYDVCDDRGWEKCGPGAARNFCWDDAIRRGAKWHWVMDDNSEQGFYWFVGKRTKVRSGAMFCACEDFVGRYENVAIAGLNYDGLAVPSDSLPVFRLNTRIYSFLLIRNDIGYRWRGRYNEDTDICLRVLKDGWCTVLFNAFLAKKEITQKLKGGNTEEFYDLEGTMNKSKMLADLHPDCSKVVWRHGRWHHHTDYSKFTQPLIRKAEYKNLSSKPNNYGMKVIDVDPKNLGPDTRSYFEERCGASGLVATEKRTPCSSEFAAPPLTGIEAIC